MTFKRSVFWMSYSIGTLILLFSFLLAQAPRGRNTDFTLDYICWSSGFFLMLACISVARRPSRSVQNGNEPQAPIAPLALVAAAWAELAFSVYGIMSFATSR
jgi:hypothetical protein